MFPSTAEASPSSDKIYPPIYVVTKRSTPTDALVPAYGRFFQTTHSNHKASSSCALRSKENAQITFRRESRLDSCENF